MYFLKLYVDLHPENKLKDISEIEKIDFRNVSTIENVLKEQVIGEAISLDTMEDEEQKEIVTKFTDLKELQKIAGEGIYIKENEPSRLYASKNGQIVVKDGKFTIEDKIDLDEISFKTGNVTFVGDIVVHGDIKPGFTVNARNILIEGTVDNSQLIAGERVIVKGGVIGQQNNDFCKIKAGKITILNFIENSNIECDGDVYIKKSSMQTDIFANGRIAFYGEPGLVVGGELIARKNIFLKIVGSKWGTKTILKVGIDPFKYLRLKKNEAKLNKFIKLSEEVNKSIDYINSVLEDNENEEGKESLLQELEEIIEKKNKFDKSIKRLENIINNIKDKIEKEKEKFKLQDTKIYVFEKVNPGVEFRVSFEHFKVFDDLGATVVTADEEGNVKLLSMKE